MNDWAYSRSDHGLFIREVKEGPGFVASCGLPGRKSVLRLDVNKGSYKFAIDNANLRQGPGWVKQARASWRQACLQRERERVSE